MKQLQNLVSAILAGVMISFGGGVYLACESKVVGAILFSLGLTVILLNGFLLFTGKTAYLPWQTIILGALCGILVYIAVDFFKSDDDKKAFNKYLIVFTAIPAFILCGFEHSVADMFYFAASGQLYTGKGIVYILLVTVGNLVGAVVFHVVRKFVTAQVKK